MMPPSDRQPPDLPVRCSYCMPAKVFDHSHVFLRKYQLLRLTELDRIIAAP